MFSEYGETMDCLQFMNEACISDKCPYYEDSFKYCSDCEYLHGTCAECLFYKTPECKEKEGI